jgi:hypothetical protein
LLGIYRIIKKGSSTTFRKALVGIPQYIGGGSGHLKVTTSCESPHLAKIQGMKSISKPRLPIEIYAFQEIMSTEEFRKIAWGTIKSSKLKGTRGKISLIHAQQKEEFH